MSPTRRAALLAGLLYFSTHLTSVAAVAVYGSAVTDPNYFRAGGSATPVLVGAVLELALALGVLGTGVVLLPYLTPYGPASARAFSAMRTMEAAVIAVGTLPMLALVRLQPAASDVTGESALIGTSMVALHQAAFLVGQGLIISVNTLVLAALLRRSQMVPQWIGTLGLVGGTLVLSGNLLQLFGVIAKAGTWAGLFAVPVFAFEISFAGYLVFRGLRAPARMSGGPRGAARINSAVLGTE